MSRRARVVNLLIVIVYMISLIATVLFEGLSRHVRTYLYLDSLSIKIELVCRASGLESRLLSTTEKIVLEINIYIKFYFYFYYFNVTN